jgi:Uma2 family endonuclease
MVETLSPGEIVATADQRVILYDAPWSLYEELLAQRGQKSVPRLVFWDGALEIMTPSFNHDLIAHNIGCLVEAYADHEGIEITGIGSWTQKKKRVKRGAEPDQCYIVGEPFGHPRPDFAIEVVWTSGGLSKLDVWRKLGVPEVWIWQDGELTVHALRGEKFELVADSRFVPGIDLELVARLATLSRPAALRALRATFRRKRR